MDLLHEIDSPEKLKRLPERKLPVLCAEIRKFLIESLAVTGGHLASNLGAVELTVAIDRVYDPYKDRILFDVGHQSYTHKLLTGRIEGFGSLRQYGGLSGFPKPCESAADAFVAGHASDSVSVALGMAKARTRLGEERDIVAVIGDGAVTGGLAYEGLINAGQSREPMVVVLNDNGMSISNNVGGMAELLTRMRVAPGYFEFKRRYREVMRNAPHLYDFFHRMKENVKDSILPDNIFDDLGFYYLGPVDGHDVNAVETALRWARDMRVPVLLHVITVKGKGCAFAEQRPDVYHGVGPYDPVTGELKTGTETFADAFGRSMELLAAENPRLMAVTAAMEEGTGLGTFAARFPDRVVDVGIAEGHAVSMSAGMAASGLVPVAAIYSSFLQRGYDMLIHDVSLMKLHVVLAVDRAGLVGGDGETHNGVFDVAYLRSVPGMTVYAPASFAELDAFLRRAVTEDTGPVALRYPRGGEGKYKDCDERPCAVLRGGTDVTVVAYGTMINEAASACDILRERGVCAELIKLGRIAPLDVSAVADSVLKTGRLVVPEEVCAAGCIGEELLSQLAGETPLRARLINLGSGLAPHGARSLILRDFGLDAAGIADAAEGLVKP